jgi:hypothetical protein
MPILEFLPQAHGYVRIHLRDGSIHTGRFRTDILSETALSAYFEGDARDISLPVDAILTVEPVESLPLAS